MADLGTVYLTETLFLRGVDPSRPAGEVDGLPALVELGHRLLDANKTRLGHVTTGDTRPGRENWVYGRGTALPALRHSGQEGRAGPAGPGTGQVLVPGLPEIASRAARHERRRRCAAGDIPPLCTTVDSLPVRAKAACLHRPGGSRGAEVVWPGTWEP